ncbi:F-Box Protein92 [Hibiscus trionum]|uniref:F-Box Protein92 n=1 Tax=Hibiscus trionum TaxID=183268 RepID=A0A9W7H4E3_HIBTR|nr:F-Box Protein92 [Hibiscus trionum]
MCMHLYIQYIIYILLLVCLWRNQPRRVEPAASMTMDRLPREVVVNILSRLPFTSLLSSKLVYRAWRTLIHDPFLISKHLDEAAGNDPSFILESNWHIPNQRHFIDFFDHSEGQVISKKLPAINSPTTPMYLIDSCNGLLCMHDASRTVFICNPFTGLYIQPPKPVKFPTLVGGLWFGFQQTTKQYKVIQIVFRRQLRRVNSSTISTSISSTQSEVQILTLGNPSWRNLGTIPYRFIHSKSKTLVHGRFHWLTKPNKNTTATLLISFDLETEQFHEVPRPDCCCGSDKCFRQLMVVRGCLSTIAFHGDYGERLEIWVMREYGVKESWIKEISIGAYCLPPTLLQQEILHSHTNLRPNLFVRFLCVLKNGEILLEYKSKALIVYDPRYGTSREFTFPEMPNHFKIVVHVGSLNWLQ